MVKTYSEKRQRIRLPKDQTVKIEGRPRNPCEKTVRKALKILGYERVGLKIG